MLRMRLDLVNKRVVVSGLQSRNDLNGKTGKVMSYDEQRERFYVAIDDFVSANSRTNPYENLVSLREENLILIAQDQNHTNNQSQAHSHSTGDNASQTRNGANFEFRFVSEGFRTGLEALRKTFDEGNLGIFGSGLVISRYMRYSISMSSVYILGGIMASEVVMLLGNHLPAFLKKVIYEPVKYVKQKHRYYEHRLGNYIMETTGVLAPGHHVWFGIGLVYTLFTLSSYGRYNDFGYGYSYGGSNLFGFDVDFSNVSLLSLAFLAMLLYKLDIPRNGLGGALQRLNIFEMVWLFQFMQQIFGGNRNHHRRHMGPGPGMGMYRGRHNPYNYGYNNYRY